ncbi:MAG: hypothetical protein EXS36_06560 [Pedosphaera sp.]|nr:hypothetical protein [Pedosphaera sp.]
MTCPFIPVSFYYDTDAAGFYGLPIAENLPLSGTGTYLWNPSPDLPSANYYVYAVADDEKNVPVHRYAATKIVIVDPKAPVTPRNFHVQPGGENSLLVTWDPNSEPDLHGYQINYAVDAGAGTELTEVVDAGNRNWANRSAIRQCVVYDR